MTNGFAIGYTEGDVTAAVEDIIVHGCNAQGVMGSGVAKAIRDKWPGAFEVYREAYDERGLALGEVIWYTTPEGKLIANAITQEFYGRDKKRYVDYDAVRKAFTSISGFAKKTGKSVAMPKIGAGLGGGNWTLIENLVEICFDIDTVTVYLGE